MDPLCNSGREHFFKIPNRKEDNHPAQISLTEYFKFIIYLLYYIHNLYKASMEIDLEEDLLFLYASKKLLGKSNRARIRTGTLNSGHPER